MKKLLTSGTFIILTILIVGAIVLIRVSNTDNLLNPQENILKVTISKPNHDPIELSETDTKTIIDELQTVKMSERKERGKGSRAVIHIDYKNGDRENFIYYSENHVLESHDYFSNIYHRNQVYSKPKCGQNTEIGDFLDNKFEQ